MTNAVMLTQCGWTDWSCRIRYNSHNPIQCSSSLLL